MGTAEQPTHEAGAGPATAPPAARRRNFAHEVFFVLGDRLASRVADIELFTATGCSYEEWCTWEAVAAFQAGRAPDVDQPDLFPGAGRGPSGAAGAGGAGGMGWKVQPRIPYASVGVTGSRETADLLVTDSARGERVVMEMSIIHDWSRNEWIDKLDGDTEKLSRPLTPGVARLQVILAASLESPIDVNPVWQQWLGMSKVWNRPTDLKRVMPLGIVGQLNILGWVLPGP